MSDLVLLTTVAVRTWAVLLARRLAHDERGEGVISTAIAVLIMAFLGALMWVGFREIWLDAESNTSQKVGEIGD